jgi:hypothetical protein
MQIFLLKMISTDDCDEFWVIKIKKWVNLLKKKKFHTIIYKSWSTYIHTENYAYRNFADPNIVHIKGCRLVGNNGY